MGLAALSGLLGLSLACGGRSGREATIVEILRADDRFQVLLERAEEHRLQVLIGRIDTSEQGNPRLVQDGFRVDAEYFYPASTIKLPAAIAALETLPKLGAAADFPLGLETPLAYQPLFADEVLETEDPANLDGGAITLAQEIRKLFLVSDNQAYNRLYELVGPAALNASMHQAGLGSSRIVHRLSEPRSQEENLRLPQIEFRGPDSMFILPERRDSLNLGAQSIEGLEIGDAYVSGGEKVEGAMDFRSKNRFSLVDLQRALTKVVRPDLDVGGAPFRLGESDRALLLSAMTQLPRESANPLYDSGEYPDHWVKFLLPGLRRVLPPERLRVANKIGRAYGFSIENAYVEDMATGRAFFLAAVIYTNRDGVLNDDRYEYDEIAFPFFADLGEAVARALWE